MPRYLDPKADITFKKIFGDHPDLLLSFLNAVLPLPFDKPIVSLTYLPSEQVPVIPSFKNTLADVKCTDGDGRVFIVEMQMNWTSAFRQRLLFGTSQALVKQLERGQDYHLMTPVIGLGLVAENYDPSLEWYHYYKLIKIGSQEQDFIDNLQLVFIELPKFPVYSPKEKKLRLLWLRFLREIDEKTQSVSQELLDIPEIAKAIDCVAESAYSKGELEVYEKYWDSIAREKTLLTGSKAEGITEGVAQGIAIGEKQGIQIGEKQGLERVAMNMLKANKSLDEISLLTGLSPEHLAILCQPERIKKTGD